MSNERDTLLQGMFAEANDELADENFTGRVVAKTLSWRYRLVAAITGLALLLMASAWLFDMSLLAVSKQVSQVFTIALFNLGEGWAAWLFAPVNNIGGVLILCAKAWRMLRKKIIAGSF